MGCGFSLASAPRFLVGWLVGWRNHGTSLAITVAGEGVRTNTTTTASDAWE